MRSLYAETIKEKATVLANIVASRLNAEQNPAVIHPTLASTEDDEAERRYRFVVRNFSDAYDVKVAIQLHDDADADGARWTGRKTLRCALASGAVAELVATRSETQGVHGVRYGVVAETYGADGAFIARYSEQH